MRRLHKPTGGGQGLNVRQERLQVPVPRVSARRNGRRRPRCRSNPALAELLVRITVDAVGEEPEYQHHVLLEWPPSRVRVLVNEKSPHCEMSPPGGCGGGDGYCS